MIIVRAATKRDGEWCNSCSKAAGYMGLIIIDIDLGNFTQRHVFCISCITHLLGQLLSMLLSMGVVTSWSINYADQQDNTGI